MDRASSGANRRSSFHLDGKEPTVSFENQVYLRTAVLTIVVEHRRKALALDLFVTFGDDQRLEQCTECRVALYGRRLVTRDAEKVAGFV